MTSYRLGGKAETIHSYGMVMVGILASQLLLAAEIEAQGKKAAMDRPFSDPYRLSHVGSSMGQSSQVGLLPFQTDDAAPSLEAAVTRLYETLVAEQEPLGIEFASVLHEHRWDLYES